MTMANDAPGKKPARPEFTDDGVDNFLVRPVQFNFAALVPLFAIGPGSERLGGLKRNDEIGQSLIDLVRSPTP